MSRGSKKAPCEPVVDARSKCKRREENRSILATLPHPNIPLIVLDSTDDEEEEDEDVLPFSLNRSFKPSFPNEEGITLEDIEVVVGTVPWAEKGVCNNVAAGMDFQTSSFFCSIFFWRNPSSCFMMCFF